MGYSILVVVRYQGWLRTSNLNNDPDALRLLRLFMGVMKAVKSGNFSRVDVLNTRLVARERIGALPSRKSISSLFIVAHVRSLRVAYLPVRCDCVHVSCMHAFEML